MIRSFLFHAVLLFTLLSPGLSVAQAVTEKEKMQKKLSQLLSTGNPNPEELYSCYNALGSIHWYAAENDSAEYYFTTALKTLDKAPETPKNKYYRKALLKNNLAGIYRVKGNTTEAIKAMQDCIQLCSSFLGITPAPPERPDAQDLHFRAIENLGGIYKDLGNYGKTEELLLYAYELKKKNLKADSPGIFISQILLGQLYFAKRNYYKAIELLEKGRKGIAAQEGDYLYWHGDACYSLALVYDKLGEEVKAGGLYTEAGRLYEKAFGTQYDFVYLEYMQNHALFLSETKQCTAAAAKSNKTLDYLMKVGEKNSLQHVQQLLNMSEIAANCGQHKAAIGYAGNALSIIQERLKNSDQVLDSIQIEIRRPRVLLMKVRSAYALLQEKNEASLNTLLTELRTAENVLERRKSVLYDEADQTLLLAAQQELLQFINKLLLELNEVSGKEAYLRELVRTHEANIYSRIRSRMESRKINRFAFVPDSLLKKEILLKQAISSALQTGSQEKDMGQYLAATAQFETFREQLKRSHPRYFSMRYGPAQTNLEHLRKQLPPNTCFVRYIFVGNKLLVTTGDRNATQFKVLDAQGIDSLIPALQKSYSNAAKTGQLLHQLYRQLWAPIEKMVPHPSVIVLPDGILYHLNFETLLRKPATDFRDFPKEMLLANQAFSYRNSLQMLEPVKNNGIKGENYVAFVPGFMDEAGNLPETEQAYSSLLPLPFSDKLASKMADHLGGTLFSGSSSTISNFQQNAGNHRIIHIGTHAEANNLFPEYSRLLFSPDTSSASYNYTLYLPDIYQCDLRSELTVLTACESGSPGYQDGEGMISLAHAFQYAGSNSMLTALWKIDEQSSVAITELFYSNLAKGILKDEALRQAKLSYLASAKGRTLSPEYWAGLVLMGDTGPVDIPFRNRWLIPGLLAIAGIVAALLAIFLQRKHRRRTRRSSLRKI